MEQTTINPFPSFSKDIPQGLNAIIAALGASPSVDDVNNALITFISSATHFNYASNPLNEVELNSYFPTAINAYINGDINGIAPNQVPFINLLLNKIKDIPPLQIKNFIINVEEQIAAATLSLQRKDQLYMATAVAAACTDYWVAQINMPPSSPSAWASFFDTNIAVNIATLPYWITAAIRASLYFCFKGNYETSSIEPPKISGPNYVTVLTAALGISTGIVIFKWTQKISMATPVKYAIIKSRDGGGTTERKVSATIEACDNVADMCCTLTCQADCAFLSGQGHNNAVVIGKNEAISFLEEPLEGF